MFIVPTRALVEQTVRELRTQLPGVSVGVLYADEKRLVDHGVNVTTYASLHLAVARQAVPDPIRRSALAFVDEAHHAMTPRRVEALDDALDPSAVRVALTATPDYDSDRRLCRFFPDLIHEVELAEALRLGLLAPVRVWVAEVDADGSRVRLMAGDYEREALGCLMGSAPFFRAVEVFRYRDSHAPLPCLIACSSRQQAHDLWRYLQRHRPEDSPAPGLILGETPGQRRKRLLADFERGRLDTLIQVGVLIEGWSSPRCKLLIDLAPSMSRVRATQKYFRVMTRHGDREARICVLLPTRLSCPPILPMDLLLDPGDRYRCGDLLDDRRRRRPRPLRRHEVTPVEGVRLRQRILVCARLGTPTLDPADLSQVREVVESCPDFDPAAPCGRVGFRRLIFQHRLFTGTGTMLLRWLRVPAQAGALEAFLAPIYPDAMADRLLAGAGRWPGPSDAAWDPDSCDEDRYRFETALLTASGRGGAPVEPFPSTLRALAGPYEAPPGPEEAWIRDEGHLRLLRQVCRLPPRPQHAIVAWFGLLGEPERTLEEIGEELDVSRGRARQIIWTGLRKLTAALLRDRLALERESLGKRWWLPR